VGNVAQRERWVMEERPRAQTKKCVCFTKGPGRVTSLLILEAACIVLVVWVVSDIPLAGAPGSSVQVVIVRTARVSRGEKFLYSSIVLLATLSTENKNSSSWETILTRLLSYEPEIASHQMSRIGRKNLSYCLVGGGAS
jgi:hypothetical protein